MSEYGLGWWGSVAGIISLIWVVCDRIARIASPPLKNWWSQRSMLSLQDRIEKLKKKLADCVAPSEMLSMTEDRILFGITFAGMMLVFIMQVIPLLLILGLSAFKTSESHPIRMSPSSLLCIIFICIFSYVLALIANQKYIEELSKYRSLRSPVERGNLEASIRKLRQKLDSKIQTSSPRHNEIIN